MISKKMLPALLIAAGFVAFPASSATADPQTVTEYPVAPNATTDATTNRADILVAPLPASQDQVVPQDEIDVAYRRDLPDGDYLSRSRRSRPNAADPLGAYSKVNPLEPSPG
jgi:hypothetical protein